MEKAVWACKGRHILCSAVMLVCLCWQASASLSLQNYDNHPDLAKAMEYDLEQNHSDYDKGDRALAEKYYLAYLEDANDSFQKARVYGQLGVMYATSINLQKGDKPDLGKSRAYFRKVLEIEPERIGWATIRARTMLASMEETELARIRGRMDVYEWVRSIDEEKIKRLWLPLRPDNTSPFPLQFTRTLNIREDIESNCETNIIFPLSSSVEWLDPQVKRDLLLEMSSRFKGSELAKFADEKLGKEFIASPEPNDPAPVEVQPEPNEVSKDQPIEPEPPKEVSQQDKKTQLLPLGDIAAAAGVVVVLAVVALLLKKPKTD